MNVFAMYREGSIFGCRPFVTVPVVSFWGVPFLIKERERSRGEGPPPPGKIVNCKIGCAKIVNCKLYVGSTGIRLGQRGVILGPWIS